MCSQHHEIGDNNELPVVVVECCAVTVFLLFAAPCLSPFLLCNDEIDGLSGNRPNRSGSVLLHQFQEGLCNYSLPFFMEDNSCSCLKNYRLDHPCTCGHEPSCA